jgi:putative ABC transport system permease protein
MRTPLAWRNVLHSRMRSFAALCGISFAIVLIFMQLGFYASAKRSATLLFSAMDFDLMLVSPEYLFVARTGTFPLSRLEEMRAIPGVESVAPVWQGFGEWRNPETRLRWGMLVLAVDPTRPVFRAPQIAAQMTGLQIPDNALFDTLSRPEFGHLKPGVASEIEHHRLRLVGDYTIGTGFVAGASVIISDETLRRLFGGKREDVSLGLVRLSKDASATEVARQINARAGSELRALTRAEINHAEETFWLNVKPIGVMFTSGVLIAFIVGIVILYQVLASEVQNRLREYATLKALGYSDAYVYGTVLRQAVIFAVLGYLPAVFWALLIYALLRSQAMLPVDMPVTRLLGVLGLTLVMCLSAAFFALGKLRAADPADLF